LFYGLMNMKEGIFSFVNAGHMPALYFDYQRHEVSELSASGIPLGVLPHASYEQRASEFKSGDRLLLYTDGLTDARGSKGFFGIDRLTSGACRVRDVDVATLSETELAAWRNAHVGFVFQTFNLIPVLTALENVELPMLYTHPARTSRETRSRASRVLQEVGLDLVFQRILALTDRLVAGLQQKSYRIFSPRTPDIASITMLRMFCEKFHSTARIVFFRSSA